MYLKSVRRSINVLLCVFALFVWAGAAHAQTTASIVGTVTDPSGAVVPNATVTVRNLETNVTRSQPTGTSGDYAFTELQIGTYSVTVTASGFKTFVNANVPLTADQTARVDAKLQIGAAAQTVQVTGAPPILQTDTSTVSSLVTSTATQDLPLNGRNVINLVQLVPGANEGSQSSLGGGTRPDDRRQTSSISVNGQNDSSNNFLLDGMDNNERSISTMVVKPAVDALEEVHVDTDLFPANLSRVGGAVIDEVTKSGTNAFHGDAFEFLRNNVLDAKDAFNVPIAGVPGTGKNGELRQNDFGGSIGGPIKKNKTFFFADYEGLDIVRAGLQTTFIPTPCELTGAGCPVPSATGGLAANLPGNFSDLCTAGFNGSGVCNDPTEQIYQPNSLNNPSSSTPYPYNIIPTGQLNSIAENYLKLYPVETGCTVANAPFSPLCLYSYDPNTVQNFHTGDVRIDQHFSPSDSFFGRYTINDEESTFPGAWPGVNFNGVTVYGDGSVPIGGTFPGNNYGRQQNLTLGWDHIFSPTTLIALHAGVSRFVNISTANNASHDVNTLFGGPANVNVPSIPGLSGLATAIFNVNNYAAIGDQFALPTDYWDTVEQYRADLTTTHGPHTWKMGGSVIRRNWERYQQLVKGFFNFSPQETSVDPTSGNAAGGNAIASFLTGAGFSTSLNQTLVPQYNRDWEVGAYILDNWHATSNLTLNLGVRYDVFTWFTNKYNAMSNFDPTNFGELTYGHILVAGQNGVSNTVNMPTQHNMIQPRLGFALRLPARFVLRGGFGTTYYASNSAGPSQMDNQPFATNVAEPFQAFGTPQPFPVEDPSTECLVAACGAAFQAPGSGGLSVGDATQLTYQNTMIILGNLTLEKAFGNNDVSVAWVGEYGRHGNRPVNDVNIPAPPGLVPTSVLGGQCSLYNPVTNPNGVTSTIFEPSPCDQFYGQLPYVGLISLLESNGYSNYNGANFVYTHRYSRGLTLQANYTFDHALANFGGPGGSCDGCTLLPNNLRYDYGNANYMVKNRVAVMVDYALPFGKSLTGVEGQIVKGWEVNGIYSYESGEPFQADTFSNQTGINGQDRPNRGPATLPFHQTLNDWFNTSQFTLQPFGFPGNEALGSLFAPSMKTMSFSFFKNFQLRESLRLQFRTEIFNLTNTPSYTTPNNAASGFSSGVGSPATTAGGFGSITATNAFYTPREIQFALKLLF